MNGSTARLVLKSRRRLVRDALAAYLATQPEFSLVGQTGDLEALVELCRLRRPDAVLVDTVELTQSKVEVLAQVHDEVPGAALIVTYADASPHSVTAALGAGVTALVPCCRGLEAVLRAIREEAHPSARRRPNGLALTDYDMRVMSLLSSGHSVPEMAELLQVSTGTVENHKRRLYVKLGVSNSGHAVARAGSLGLVDPPRAYTHNLRDEPGRTPLMVIAGTPGPMLDDVQTTLLGAGLPFVHTRTRASLEQEHWVRWQRGPVVVILINPTHDDWLLPAGLGARTMVVDKGGHDLPTIVDMLLRGARALVHADDVRADLASLIAVVARGYMAIDACHVEDVAGWMAVRLAHSPSVVPALTARECDVLNAIAGGHTIRETANSLGIAAKTVENTQARLYRKLGARNRMDAMTIAQRLGLFERHH